MQSKTPTQARLVHRKWRGTRRHSLCGKLIKRANTGATVTCPHCLDEMAIRSGRLNAGLRDLLSTAAVLDLLNESPAISLVWVGGTAS